MDSRAADSLFGGADDSHDFFTSLDGVNTSPKQNIQQPVVESSQSAPTDPYTAVPYSSASEASTAQANHTQDPYAQAANHVQAASSYDPYAPLYASHPTAAHQPIRSTPSQPAATPYAPYTTPAATSSMTTAQAYDPYAPVAAARPAATTSYMPSHSYNPAYTPVAAAPSLYAPPQGMVPPPPAPKNVDASQFRVKPNAYDPPIRDAVPTRSAPRIPPAFTHNTPYSPPANHSYGAPAPAYVIPPPRTPSIPPPPLARMTPPPLHQSSQVHPLPMRPPSTPQPPKAVPPPPAHRNSLDLSSSAHAPTTSTAHLSTHVHGTQYIPRTSSPLVPRPVNGTGSPRPSSVASNKSVHSQPPRAPSVVSSAASQSRPSSAASNTYAPPPRSRSSVSSASPVESSGRASAKLPSPTLHGPPPALVPPLEIEEQPATARPNDHADPFNIIPPSFDNLASYEATLGSPQSQASAIPSATSPPSNLYHNESHTNVESKPEGHQLDSLEDPESAFGTDLRQQPNEVDEFIEHRKELVPSPPSDPYALVKPIQSPLIPQQPHVDPYAPAQTRQPMDPYAPTHGRQPTDPSHSRKSTDPYAPRQDPYSSTASIASGPPRRQTLEGARTPPPAPASVLDLTHSPSPPRAVKPPGQAADPYRPTVPSVPSSGLYQPVAPPPVLTGTYQPVSTYQPMQPPLSIYQPAQLVPPPPQPVHEPPAEQYATIPSTLSSSQHSMYAPSPSLLGTNDPLGRTSLRVPVVSFGFGGKVVLCFHKNPAEAGGFDTAMSARPATQISFRPIKDVVPSSVISTQTHAGTPFPGPLFCDQAPATAGMLAGAAANTKAKKAALLQWLDELAVEAEREVGYVGNDSVFGRPKAEGKSVLIKLLKVLVENDGKLAGSPTIEAAVRTALLGAAPESFVSGDMLGHGFGYPGTGGPGLGGHSTAVATYQVKTASLDRLQELLIRGERRKAYQFASDEKMWAHALLIASNLDKSAWKEVVSEFIQAELGVLAGMDSPINAPSANKRGSLRVAYGLIAGDSAAALKQLVPPRLLGQGPQINMLVPGRPVSPAHASAAPISVPTDALVQWKDILTAIYSNHNAGDDTPLTALGDQLVAKQWIEAAHCCYLLASGLSSMSGTVCPAPRIALFGSEHPAQARSFHTDLLPVVLSEVAEYSLSLTPTTKGQEPYPGLSHLQAYRLWHAACLAETGDVSLALRYTEAIHATLRMSSRASPYFTSTFLEQLKDLHNHLTGAPHGDKKNFLSKAITKPSMETFNTWITGGLTKLIEGDEPTPQPQDQQAEAKPVNGATLGPFSHYSTISSNAPSKSPSPAPSFTGVHGMSTIPPPRTASTGGYRPPANGLSPMPVAPPPNRSASAIDYTQTMNRKPSPGPKVLSPYAATSTSQVYENGYTPYNSDQINASSAEDAGKAYAGPETGSWWGSSNGGTTASATPTASTFLRANAGELSEGEGPQFISLGDSDSLFAPSVTPSIAPSSPRYTTAPSSHDEDDDLGLGNSKSRKKKSVEEEDDPESTSGGPPKTDTKAAPAPKADPKKEEAKPQNGTTSGGWFGWFKKSDTPKPVKANLGKESSFYYDPDLGRWVNKAADAGDTAPKAPLPPPRAQTVPPGNSVTSEVALATTTPPPPRAASVVASNRGVAPPPRPSSTLTGPSSLIPSTSPGPPPPLRLPSDAPPKAGTPPPPRTMGQTPPPGGPTAGGAAKAAKRNPRSRYVDVFQQQQT